MEKHTARILIVDDDEAVLTTARLFLKQKFSYVHVLSQPSQLTQVLAEMAFDVLLLDMNFQKGENEGMEGLELINRVVKQSPKTEIIPITAYGEIDLAVEALKRGARDFITKPWHNEKLYSTIQNILQLKEATGQIHSLKEINQQLIQSSENVPMIGSSTPFRTIMTTIRKVAPTDANVLILGENGTGKELVARAIHLQSDRKDRPFIKIDLGALPDTLFESELFGHVKGAFTDAKEDRMGKLAVANGGTVFLDEIGNISLSQQSKLLTVLQSKKVTPVGSNKEISLDIRIISATNSKLTDRINDRSFRQDLFFRINTIEIKTPPLRERVDDIPLLAQHYLDIEKKRYSKKGLKLSKEAIRHLQEYTWPGNIRELKHVMERTVILAEDQLISPATLALGTIQENESETTLNLEEMEKKLILKSLEKNKGNITHAARDLGIDRQALYRRLEKYGL